MKVTTTGFQARIGNRDFPLLVVRKEEQNPTALHNHEFTELVVIYRGEGDHYLGEGEMPFWLKVGEVMVIPQGMPHRYGEQGSVGLVNILFERRLLPLPLLDVGNLPGFNFLFGSESSSPDMPPSLHLDAEELRTVMTIVDRLEDELSQRSAGYQFAAMSLFMELVVYLSRQVSGPVHADASPPGGISRAMSYLHEHFHDPGLRIETVAAGVNMSMSTLLRYFKQRNGCSPKDYLMRLRIRYAGEMLLKSTLNISEVAFRCGFDDSNYFSREFKKRTGMTPAGFRKQIADVL